jgi:hypothetical protein
MIASNIVFSTLLPERSSVPRVPSHDASSMSAPNCEDTFNQDNLREEIERCLFNTSLFLEMSCCCFIPVCLGFATLLTLIKKYTACA